MKDMQTFYYDTLEQVDISIYIVATDKGLSYVKRHLEAVEKLHPEAKFIHDEAKIAVYKQQLIEYFDQKRETFDLPYDIQIGTTFQRSVWDALLTIPYGETVSYADIGEKINNPKAVRAIGNANGKNPISIIIPCHRVVQKDGKLGGYSSGLDMKRYLLQLEQDDD
ncbi:MAG TPA: methylated-DNA--[protein]-cysteine S-methyltransferase [Pseudogracilibacillus sp.]|nr:methylated-DNA--[protein]-cysteine S-methyltransferase [Pseudogracilibacillus sp.]